MLKTLLTAMVACGLLTLQAHAAEPSFDCSKTEHEAEDIICKDAELKDR